MLDDDALDTAAGGAEANVRRAMAILFHITRAQGKSSEEALGHLERVVAQALEATARHS